jgi:hypothetical protein
MPPAPKRKEAPVEATKNPEYLRALAAAVEDFKEAFRGFMDLHLPSDHLRGLAPAVEPRDDTTPAEIAEAQAKVDRAAGRAMDVAAVTGVRIGVQGEGVIDPFAAWHTIAMPKPLLEPANIFGACEQALGRLEAMIRKAEAEAPPAVGAEAMHPLVWGAARRLWGDGHYREAVAGAAETLAHHLKVRTGRSDVTETALWAETFSDKEPQPGKPRLRWPGDPRDSSVRSMNSGLRQLAPGVQLTIRNTAAHGVAPLDEQEASERLAVLSLLARWVEECELVEAPSTE